MHVDGRNKNILVFGEGLTQGSDNATITAEAKYPISFTESGKQSVLSLHYNGSNGFLFVSLVKMYQFKAKDSCLANISKDFTLNNMKKED